MYCPACGQAVPEGAERCACGHSLRGPGDGAETGVIVRYRREGGEWQEIRSPRGELVLGRSEQCDVRLESTDISRRHARLAITATGITLTDLGSTNGTQIGEAPLTPHRPAALCPGQHFTVGPYTLLVELPVSPPAAAAALPEPGPAAVTAPPAHQEPQPAGKAVTPPAAVPGAPAAPAPSEAELASETMLSEPGAEPVLAPVRPLDLSALPRLAIGRASDNDLVLPHPLVSRYHAEIEKIGQRIQLRDLHSTNGCFVNGARIDHQAWLQDNDQVQIGPYVFTLAGSALHPRVEEGLLLEAHNLNQYVSRRLNLLQNLNLIIKPMEFVAVVGMSGSGKTTLLNALSGYRPASGGEVLVNGVNLYEHYDLFRNDVGYVPQKDIVHMELTPYTALEYVARLRMPPDTTPQERAQAVMDVLADLDLTERKNVPISRLSGGQLKRVSIGVELLTKPRLFFLDEPTSGLDPGTEHDMMRLLRRLADQGRTVMLVTHATKNVVLCDKVLFLARGGYLTFFGTPDEALTYFDQYRTLRERQQKEMEFDDIYRILNDEKRGTPWEWALRFVGSPAYVANFGLTAGAPAARSAAQRRTSAQEMLRQKGAIKTVSAFRQFLILSGRNLKILLQDKVSLALMLMLAPLIGLLDFIWGHDIFDPVKGDPAKILTMWFLSALITVLVGALSSVREIVKEANIYQRERAVNLKVIPYILSKVWVGLVLALYQSLVLLLARVLLVRPELPGTGAYVALYVTLFLSTLCGYLIGLVISAGAPNQNAAMLLIILVLVPQFMFAGALLPLDLIPGGELISVIMPTRWTFEAYVNLSGLGRRIVNDPCWKLPENARKALTEDQKKDCPCYGANIFAQSADFPGILSADFYDAKAQQYLAQRAPVEPQMPTAFPSPTALPTPTLLPSPTPAPMPGDLAQMGEYMKAQQTAGQAYQDKILKQFDEYRRASVVQGQAYEDQRTKQGDEYRDAMQAYGDARSAYETGRQKAISGAEGLLESVYDNYGRAFRGTVVGRWAILCVIMAAMVGLLMFFQKRKDII